MTKNLRYAMVSAGGYARHVHRILSKLGDTTLAAVCARRLDAAEAMAKPCGATAYTDFDAMLEREQLDAVCICLPPFAHKGEELKTVKRGIHLFATKPIAMDYGYAAAVADAIDAAGVVSCVSYAQRYAEPIRKAKELLQGKPVVLAEGHVSIRVSPGKDRPWITRKECSNGQLFTQACHMYDLYRYLIGEVAQVSAIRAVGFIPRSDVYDVEDAAIVTLTFASGAVGQVSCTVMAPNEYWMRLTAREISMVYSTRENVLHVEDLSKRWDHPTPADDEGHEEKQLRSFVHAIRTGDRSGILTPYRDALGSLRIALAAVESLKTGKPVALPPAPR